MCLCVCVEGGDFKVQACSLKIIIIKKNKEGFSVLHPSYHPILGNKTSILRLVTENDLKRLRINVGRIDNPFQSHRLRLNRKNVCPEGKELRGHRSSVPSKNVKLEDASPPPYLSPLLPLHLPVTVFNIFCPCICGIFAVSEYGRVLN